MPKQPTKPTKKAPDADSTMIHIRVKLEEKALFEQAAALDHRPLSNWARLQLLKAAGHNPPKP